MKALLLPVFLSFSIAVFAQNLTISGYVKDARSGEDLIGATVFLQELPGKGTTTNQYGFYSITVSPGDYTLVVMYLGFQTVEVPLPLNRDVRVNINLESEASMLQEITVKAERANEQVMSTQMSMTELSTEEIKALPALMGEVDILRTIQLLPGVMSAGEGNTGLYVRGGGPDQNLILLDEAVVYNPGHLFGFFSVFNADAIKNTTLYKGGMPAQYGGRLSSVVDISMKDGNNRHFAAEGGIGLISSRLTLEGPIVKEKASYMVSARRTYVDVLLRPFTKGTNLEGNAYYFYDLNAKVNYRFSDKDRLYLSGYFGRDVFSFSGSSGNFNINIPWGNATMTARWNHLFSNKLFLNTSVIYNNYDFATEATQGEFNFKVSSRIEDINLKSDLDYFAGAGTRMRFGANYTFHTLSPLTASAFGEDNFSLETGGLEPKYAHEAALYGQVETDLTDRLRITAGLRLSGFQQVGPYTFTEQDSRGNVVDSTVYGWGKPVANYGGLEPRASFRYLVDEQSSFKAAFTRTLQYLHLVSNTNSTLPTDVWVPSSKRVAPQIAYQYSVGYFRNFRNDMFESSIELYYKDMQGQIEFEDGYIPMLNAETERSFVFGRGYSYGAEFFLKKRTGKLNGWIGYTWSLTERVFDDINDGNPFPAQYDRRHDLSMVAIYNLTPRWTFSSTFVYGTGNAFTMPESWYLIEGNLVANYGPRNSFRMAPYHRLDLSATLKGKETNRFSSDWVFSVYNVYNRMNPYFIYFEESGSSSGADLGLTARQVSLFPIIPTITWNFKLK